MDLHSSFTNFDIVLKMRVLFSLFRVHGRVICIVVFKKKMSTQTLPFASNEKNIQFLKRRASRCIVVAVNVLTKRLVRGAGMQMKLKKHSKSYFVLITNIVRYNVRTYLSKSFSNRKAYSTNFDICLLRVLSFDRIYALKCQWMLHSM